MAREGWIKLHRKLLDNPVTFKDPDYLAVWIFFLLEATHTEMKRDFGGKLITLKPGQLITGRPAISRQTKVEESKVERIIKRLKTEHQIEQQTSTKGRLITILNWDMYQGREQDIEQQMNNERTTSEQQVNTNKNVKNAKNVNNDNTHTGADPINNHVTLDSADLSKHDDVVKNKPNTNLDNNIDLVDRYFMQHIKRQPLSANDMVAITEACEKYPVKQIMTIMESVERTNKNVNSFNYILKILNSPKKEQFNNQRTKYKPKMGLDENSAEMESIRNLIESRGVVSE